MAVAGAAAAQTAQKPATGNKGSELITLSGCVTSDPRQGNLYTLSEDNDPTVYKLTGMNVKKYVGQRVEISGAPPKRLKITGGLYPNPNVAAQAGAIDPAKAAIAAMSEPNGGATGPMSEFRVRSVRPVPGPCPGQ